MSRAASSVETCGSSLPERSSQASAKPFDTVFSSLISASLSGLPSVAMNLSCSAVSRQRTGVESPTPRGSQPTTSNLRSSAGPRTNEAAAANWTPEAPGPPGLRKSVPILPVRSRAGTLRARSSMVSPAGLV